MEEKQKNKKTEPEDLNVMELGYLAQTAVAVTKIEGWPAYYIQLKNPVPGGMFKTQNGQSLIVIPDKGKHKVLSFVGPSIKRIPDMDDVELLNYVKSNGPGKNNPE